MTPGTLVAGFSCAMCLASVIVMIIALARPKPPIRCAQPIPMEWYLDEAAHTGDIVFFRNRTVDFWQALLSPVTHTAIMVMHPVSGEPWLLEQLDGDTVVIGERRESGVHLFPARPRLRTFDGDVQVCRIARPLPAARVLSVARGVKGTAVAAYPKAMRWRIAVCKFAPWLPLAPRGLICSEFTAWVLWLVGAWRDVEWRCVTPSDLIRVASRHPAYGCVESLTRKISHGMECS